MEHISPTQPVMSQHMNNDQRRGLRNQQYVDERIEAELCNTLSEIHIIDARAVRGEITPEQRFELLDDIVPGLGERLKARYHSNAPKTPYRRAQYKAEFHRDGTLERFDVVE